MTDAGLRSCAGVPIEDEQGRRIGALCVFDSTPRNRTSSDDLEVRRRLADTVEEVLAGPPMTRPTWIAGPPTSPAVADTVFASAPAAAGAWFAGPVAACYPGDTPRGGAAR